MHVIDYLGAGIRFSAHEVLIFVEKICYPIVHWSIFHSVACLSVAIDFGLTFLWHASAHLCDVQNDLSSSDQPQGTINTTSMHKWLTDWLTHKHTDTHTETQAYM